MPVDGHACGGLEPVVPVVTVGVEVIVDPQILAALVGTGRNRACAGLATVTTGRGVYASSTPARYRQTCNWLREQALDRLGRHQLHGCLGLCKAGWPCQPKLAPG